MKTVHIYGNRSEENVGGYNPEDEWSRDSSRTHWGIRGVSDVFPARYSSFASLETNHTGTLYALYAIHSTGDSFGHDECSQFDIIWIFNDKEKAYAAKDLIKEHADWYRTKHSYSFGCLSGAERKTLRDKFKDEYSLQVEVGEDKPLTVHASWNGYFESLDEIDVIEFEWT
jgi:hypothetical protein